MKMRKQLSVLALALVVGCGSDGRDGDTQVVQTVDEPAGSNCAAGGVAINVGIDEDEDGTLAGDEILSTSYVCSPEPPTDQLVQLAAEGPGLNCPYGGTAVNSGIDADGSGTLEAGEITSTSYVCDGFGGEDAILEGNVVITTDLELALLSAFTEVTGNLTISDAGITVVDISLPYLQAVGGDFISNNGSFETLDLPLLADVGGNVNVSGSGWTSISMASLVTVGADLTVSQPVALATLDLSSLATVTGSVSLQNISGLGELSLPALTSADSLVVINLADTVSLSFPVLADLGNALTLGNLGSATSLSFPQLTSAPGGVGMLSVNQGTATVDLSALATTANFVLIGNNLGTLDVGALTTVADFLALNENTATLSFPELTTANNVTVFATTTTAITTVTAPKLETVTGGFALQGNANLDTIDFAALAAVGANFNISDNPVLPCADALAIADQFVAGGAETVTGNLACP